MENPEEIPHLLSVIQLVSGRSTNTFSMSLCPQVSLCISTFAQKCQLLRSPPTCSALIGCIAEVQLLRQKRLPIPLQALVTLLLPQSCSAQHSGHFCCSSAALSSLSHFFKSLMTLLRDSKVILLCSLCIAA